MKGAFYMADLKKNDEIVVDIVDTGFKGEGIAKVDGLTIFIPDLLTGEKAKIKLLKVNKTIAYGKLIELLEKSQYRQKVDCSTYDKCGGCSMRHIKYYHTLKMKEQALDITLQKELGHTVKINKCVKMEEPFYYRNKLSFPVGTQEVDGKEQVICGVFSERSHRIIETKDCLIQNEVAQKIIKDIIKFANENDISGYDEEKNLGLLRHIVIRVGNSTKQIMVTLVLTNMKLPYEKELVNMLVKKYPKIRTIAKNVNDKITNVILGDKTKTIYGDGYIIDYLKEFKFKISPLSFYQVNSIQTEKLYTKAVEYAELTGKETVFDLYCGIGTIGIFASKKIKKLIGIETVPDAIKDAKENAKLNDIKHAEFHVGDVENILPKLVKEKKLKADVVFLDPPRKGCEKVVLETLLKVKPQRIVYVSCNPATLARDLKILEKKYDIIECTPVDQFCYSPHIESVTKLVLK